jgi:hypothetical protein
MARIRCGKHRAAAPRRVGLAASRSGQDRPVTLDHGRSLKQTLRSGNPVPSRPSHVATAAALIGRKMALPQQSSSIRTPIAVGDCASSAVALAGPRALAADLADGEGPDPVRFEPQRDAPVMAQRAGADQPRPVRACLDARIADH